MAKPVARRSSGVSAGVSLKTKARKTEPSKTKPRKTVSRKTSETTAADSGEAVLIDVVVETDHADAKSKLSTATTTKRATGVKTASATAETTAAAKRTTAKRTTAVQPRSLVQQVYRAIETELAKLEKQKGASSQDRERASRALSQMVNSLEKAIDMQRDIVKSTAPRAKAKDKEALRHAEDLRRQIAERLERLQPKRRAGGSTR